MAHLADGYPAQTPHSVAEVILDHSIGGDKTVSAYTGDADYLNARRPLLDAWGDYATTEPGSNVVKFGTNT